MKKIVFLLPDGELMPGTFFNALDVFIKANAYYRTEGKPPYYDVKLAGHDTKQSLFNALLTIKLQEVDAVGKPDLIIIPSLQTSIDYSTKANKQLITWLKAQYEAGSSIASLCTGAFMLAATGLIDNQECSTHWMAEDLFRRSFPGIKLRLDKIITDKNRIYTAGGGNSSLNLILYFVEKYSGREAALYCAKLLQIDIGRTSQMPFLIFDAQKDHQDDLIQKAQQFIEDHLNEKLTVELLAEQFFMSRSTFIRRFKKAVKEVPKDYIQKVRIEYAKRSLELDRKTIIEIMASVGYTDEQAFRNIFKRTAGITPLEYRTKFATM